MMHIDWSAIQSSRARGVRILMIDSGVESDHPAFEGRAIECWTANSASSPPYVRLTRESTGHDAFGHGTAVAGVLHRLAPEAELTSLRVLGSDNRCDARVVIDSLLWAAKQRFDVINCSFGTGRSYRVDASGNVYNITEAYRAAIATAIAAGSILVAASSNSCADAVEYPSAFPSVISATFGPQGDLEFRRRPGKTVEFEACGIDQRLPWRGRSYLTVTGSSFAAPQMAALVARIRSLAPSLNAAEVKSVLYGLSSYV